MKNNYFPVLTSIRAVGAYMIYIVHTDPLREEKYGKPLYDFLEEFQVSLAIFFVLSGFLITYNYFDIPKLNLRTYFVNRFARIFPIYFLLTTVTFLFFAFTKNQNSISDFWIYLSNITFIRGFSNTYNLTGLGQGWTLTVEETFYVLAPLIFLTIKKNKIYGFILPIAFFLTGLLLVFIFKDIDFYGFMNNNQFMIELTFFGRCCEFFVGIGLAIFVKQHQKKFQFKHFTYFGILAIGLCIYWISTLKGTTNSGMNTHLGLFINTLVLPVFGIAPLFYGLITERTFVSKTLETSIFQLLGKSSYVFYLIHLSFVATFLYNSISNYIINFLILNAIAIALYLLIEKPMAIYLKNLLVKP